MLSGGQLMVVLIVAIAMVASIFKSRHRAESRHRLHSAETETGEAARLRGEVQQLKDRIQVLERVITDSHSSVDLDRQIERLRDR
jgi:uncharacterized protein YlxW (UPF0749 family)